MRRIHAPGCGGSKWNYCALEQWQPTFRCKTWGIAVYNPAGEKTQVIADISQDKNFVEQLAALFTREGLEPVHFADVLDDFLACPQRLKEILDKER